MNARMEKIEEIQTIIKEGSQKKLFYVDGEFFNYKPDGAVKISELEFSRLIRENDYKLIAFKLFRKSWNRFTISWEGPEDTLPILLKGKRCQEVEIMDKKNIPKFLALYF